MRGLAGRGRRALQVLRVGVGVMVGGEVCVLAALRRRRRRRLQGRVGGLDSVLSHGGTLEAQGSRLEGPSAGDHLLLLQELVLLLLLLAPLAHRGFVEPLLLLEWRPAWTQLWTTLRSHTRVHLPQIRRHVVGLLVRGVGGRQRGLGSSLRVSNGVGWRLQGRVAAHVRGSGESCARRSALLGRGRRGSQNPHGGHG